MKCPIEHLMSEELRKRKDKCQLCVSWHDGKCHHKQDLAQAEKKSMRGLPVLTKRSAMNKPREIRIELERAALKYSGLNSKEQQEYWSVSQAYDSFWDEASPDQRQDILDCLHYWRLYLEDGLSPVEANQKVLEWLKEHSETS
jgi:hypothetical protein